MVTNIQFTGIDSSDALKQYAIEKVEDCEKFFDNIQQADIDIGLRSNHHQKGNIYYAEVNLHVPGKLVRVVKDAEDLYKAIDKVRDHLKVELEKLSGKMNAIDREEIRETKEYQIEDEL